MRRRGLRVLLLLGVACSAPALRAQNENEQIGFAQAHVFSGEYFGDAVDVLNGNLVLNIPIGQEYRASSGLNYQLQLAYNSKIWVEKLYSTNEYESLLTSQTEPFWDAYASGLDPNRQNQPEDPSTRGVRVLSAGLGFRLFLGRIFYTRKHKLIWGEPEVRLDPGWYYQDSRGTNHPIMYCPEAGDYNGATTPTRSDPDTKQGCDGNFYETIDASYMMARKLFNASGVHVGWHLYPGDGTKLTFAHKPHPAVDPKTDTEPEDLRGFYLTRIESVEKKYLGEVNQKPILEPYAYVDVEYETDPGMTHSIRRILEYRVDPQAQGEARIPVRSIVFENARALTLGNRTVEVHGGLVRAVEVPAFGGAVARYDFEYEIRDVHAPLLMDYCPTSCPPKDHVFPGVPLLRRLILPGTGPAGRRDVVEFGYDDPNSVDGTFGEVTRRRLPLGAEVQYLYSYYFYGNNYVAVFANPACRKCGGFTHWVSEYHLSRQLIRKTASGGSQSGTWRYVREGHLPPEGGAQTISSSPSRVHVTDPDGNETVYYFRQGTQEWELPYNGLLSRSDTYAGSMLAGKLLRREISAYTSWAPCSSTCGRLNMRQTYRRTQIMDDGQPLGRNARVIESSMQDAHYGNELQRVEWDTDSLGGVRSGRITARAWKEYRTELSLFEKDNWIIHQPKMERVYDHLGRPLSEVQFVMTGEGKVRASVQLASSGGGPRPGEDVQTTFCYDGDDLVGVAPESGKAYPYYDPTAGDYGCATAANPDRIRSGNMVLKRTSGGATAEGLSPPQLEVEYVYQAGAYISGKRFLQGGQPLSWWEFERDRDPGTGLVVETRDEAGIRMRFSYDALGRLTGMEPDSVNAAQGPEYRSEMRFPEAGRAFTLQGPESVLQAIPYEASAPCALAGDYKCTEYLYDAFGRLAETRERRGGAGQVSVQYRRYSITGRLLQESEWVPAGMSFAVAPKRTLDYAAYGLPNADPRGRPWRMTDPDGALTEYEYRGFETISRRHGLNGLPSSDPAGTVTKVEIQDAFGRLVLVDSEEGADAVYAYDGLDRMVEVALGELSSDRSLSSSAPIQRRSFVFDGLGRLVEETHPERGRLRYLAFDPAGNVLQLVNGRGKKLRRTLDAAGRLVKEEHWFEPPRRRLEPTWVALAEYTYDIGQFGSAMDRSQGRLTRAVSYYGGPRLSTPITERRLRYSGLNGRLDREDISLGLGTWSTTYVHDGFGLTSSMDYPGDPTWSLPLRVRYEHSNGYLTEVRTENAPNNLSASNFTYGAAGSLTSWEGGNGTRTRIDADSRGRPLRFYVDRLPDLAATARIPDPEQEDLPLLASLAQGVPSPHRAILGDSEEQTLELCTDGLDNDGDGPLDCADSGCSNCAVSPTLCDAQGNPKLCRYWDTGMYRYDGLGNIWSIGDRDLYQYDKASRLRGTTLGSAGYNWETYAYDPFGNMTARQKGLGSRPSVSWDYAVDAGTNRVQSVSLDKGAATPYQFDASGNLVRDHRYLYYYDSRDRLIEVWTLDGTQQIVRFDYDDRGLRVREYDGNKYTAYVRDRDGRLLSEFVLPVGSTTPIAWSRSYVYGGHQRLGVLLRSDEYGPLAGGAAVEPPPRVAARNNQVRTTTGTIQMAIRVFWAPSLTPEASSYRVYRRTEGSQTWVERTSTPVTGSDYVDRTGLVLDQVYYYAVRAIDRTGRQSTLSSEARVRYTNNYLKANIPAWLDPPLVANPDSIELHWNIPDPQNDYGIGAYITRSVASAAGGPFAFDRILNPSVIVPNLASQTPPTVELFFPIAGPTYVDRAGLVAGNWYSYYLCNLAAITFTNVSICRAATSVPPVQYLGSPGGPGGSVSPEAGPIAAPASFRAVADPEVAKQVHLTWTRVGGVPASRYHVYQETLVEGQPPLLSPVTAFDDPGTGSFTLTEAHGIAAGTNYRLRLGAEDTTGALSPLSDASETRTRSERLGVAQVSLEDTVCYPGGMTYWNNPSTGEPYYQCAVQPYLTQGGFVVLTIGGNVPVIDTRSLYGFRLYYRECDTPAECASKPWAPKLSSQGFWTYTLDFWPVQSSNEWASPTFRGIFTPEFDPFRYDDEYGDWLVENWMVRNPNRTTVRPYAYSVAHGCKRGQYAFSTVRGRVDQVPPYSDPWISGIGIFVEEEESVLSQPVFSDPFNLYRNVKIYNPNGAPGNQIWQRRRSWSTCTVKGAGISEGGHLLDLSTPDDCGNNADPFSGKPMTVGYRIYWMPVPYCGVAGYNVYTLKDCIQKGCTWGPEGQLAYPGGPPNPSDPSSPWIKLNDELITGHHFDVYPSLTPDSYYNGNGTDLPTHVVVETVLDPNLTHPDYDPANGWRDRFSCPLALAVLKTDTYGYGQYGSQKFLDCSFPSLTSSVGGGCWCEGERFTAVPPTPGCYRVDPWKDPVTGTYFKDSQGRLIYRGHSCSLYDSSGDGFAQMIWASLRGEPDGTPGEPDPGLACGDLRLASLPPPTGAARGQAPPDFQASSNLNPHSIAGVAVAIGDPGRQAVVAPHRAVGSTTIPLNEVLYFHSDQVGSVRLTTDRQGNRVRDTVFWPFGEEALPAAWDPNALRFAGHEREQDLGLDYMVQRYYSSWLGRFTSPDSMRARALADPQSWNKYAYTRNNPVRYFDPDGHAPQEYHRHWTRKWAQEEGYEDADALAEAVARQDDGFRHAWANPAGHFGNPQEVTSRVLTWLSMATYFEAQGDHRTALDFLGGAIHLAQDFVWHRDAEGNRVGWWGHLFKALAEYVGWRQGVNPDLIYTEWKQMSSEELTKLLIRLFRAGAGNPNKIDWDHVAFIMEGRSTFRVIDRASAAYNSSYDPNYQRILDWIQMVCSQNRYCSL